MSPQHSNHFLDERAFADTGDLLQVFIPFPNRTSVRHHLCMALISLKNVSIRFGSQPVLDGIDFILEPKDKACLVGRNGEGKSTLLRIINGDVKPDSGSIVYAQGIKVAYLPQDVPHDLTGVVRDIVAKGVEEDGPGPYNESTPDNINRVLSFLKLDEKSKFETLSGGLKRRALLARALVSNPDVLLLDEPTNHLDINSIEWLEGFLKRYVGTLLFVTHDRMFLRRLANRIVDLDRGQLNDWRCDYDTFLRRKDDLLQDEAVRNQKLDKKLSKEEVWIRQGIKARRTRDEGRVRELKDLRRQRERRRSALGAANLQLQEAGTSGQLVIKAQNAVFAYDGEPVIKDLTTTIMRGDKVGVIGPNGCGKTTLLRLLLGPYAAVEETTNQPEKLDHRIFTFELTDRRQAGLQPQSGTIRRGTRLEMAYFDQHRHELDERATVFDNIAGGSDTVVINGQPRNLFGYLQDFLFSPDRARTPIHVLSGGERNRLLLARLFSQPANLIVMDEPTNDLDADTLMLLEERLVEFSGTLLLVSHDREFLNNVVTSTLAFDEPACVREYVGGYDDWLRQRPSKGVQVEEKREKRATAARSRRLTYAENRELGRLPDDIEKLETEQAELHTTLADPKTYQQAGPEIGEAIKRMKEVEKALEKAYQRWEILESIKKGAGG